MQSMTHHEVRGPGQVARHGDLWNVRHQLAFVCFREETGFAFDSHFIHLNGAQFLDEVALQIRSDGVFICRKHVLAEFSAAVCSARRRGFCHGGRRGAGRQG